MTNYYKWPGNYESYASIKQLIWGESSPYSGRSHESVECRLRHKGLVRPSLGPILGRAPEETFPWVLASPGPWPLRVRRPSRLKSFSGKNGVSGVSLVLGFSFACCLIPRAELNRRTQQVHRTAAHHLAHHWLSNAGPSIIWQIILPSII